MKNNNAAKRNFNSKITAMKRICMTVLILAPKLLLACSCHSGDVPEKFNEHVSIFQGVVTEIIYHDSIDSFGDQNITVTFDIEKQWKGEAHQNTLHTVNNGMSCYGWRFKQKGRYIIYAFEQNGNLNTVICGGVYEEAGMAEPYFREQELLNEFVHKESAK